MAVSPQDLLSLSPEHIVIIGQIEKLVDEKLQANYEPGGECKINVTNLGDQVHCAKVTVKMKNELITRYRAVGWAVSFDPSIPDFITFSGPAAPEPKPDIVPQMSADQMLDRMAEAKANGNMSGPKPPAFTPVTRDSSPYSRSHLASKPPN